MALYKLLYLLTSEKNYSFTLLQNVDNKMRVDNEKSETESVADAPVDEYKAKLTENRRLAREKAERDAAEEELRQKKLQYVIQSVYVN